MVWAVPLLRVKLIPHALTPSRLTPGIRSLVRISGWVTPGKNLSSALPPGFSGQASPKAISGRTSYHQVRLAFHPYPQLIQCFCNSKWFGPPSDFHRSSSWSGIDHLASGLLAQTHPSVLLKMTLSENEGSRPIQTWFPYGYI